MESSPDNSSKINISSITDDFRLSTRDAFYLRFQDTPDGFASSDKIRFANAVFKTPQALYSLLVAKDPCNKKFDASKNRAAVQISFAEAFPDNDPEDFKSWLVEIKEQLEPNRGKETANIVRAVRKIAKDHEQSQIHVAQNLPQNRPEPIPEPTPETKFGPAVSYLITALGGEQSLNQGQITYFQTISNPAVLRILLLSNNPANCLIRQVTFSDLFPGSKTDVEIFLNWIRSQKDIMLKGELAVLKAKQPRNKNSLPAKQSRLPKFSRRHFMGGALALGALTIGSRFINGSTQSPSQERKTQARSEKVITNADEAIKLLFEDLARPPEVAYDEGIIDRINSDANLGASMQDTSRILRKPIALEVAACERNIVRSNGKISVLSTVLGHRDPTTGFNSGLFSLQGGKNELSTMDAWLDNHPVSIENQKTNQKTILPYKYDGAGSKSFYYPHGPSRYQIDGDNDLKSLRYATKRAIEISGGLTASELYYFVDLFNQGGLVVMVDAVKLYTILAKKFNTTNSLPLMHLCGSTGYWDILNNRFDYSLGSGRTSIGTFAWNKTQRQVNATVVSGRKIETNSPTSFVSPQNGGKMSYLGHINELPDQKFHIPFKAKVVSKFKTSAGNEPEVKKVDAFDRNGHNNPETKNLNFFEQLGVGNVVTLYSADLNRFIVYTNISNKAFDQLNSGSEYLPSNEFDMDKISGSLKVVPSIVNFGTQTADTMPGKSIGMMVFPGSDFGLTKSSNDNQIAKASQVIESKVKEKGYKSLTTYESRWETETNCSYFYVPELKGCINMETLELHSDDGSVKSLQQVIESDTKDKGIVNLNDLAKSSLSQLKNHVK